MKNAKVLQNCKQRAEQEGRKHFVFEHVSCCNLSETE